MNLSLWRHRVAHNVPLMMATLCVLAVLFAVALQVFGWPNWLTILLVLPAIYGLEMMNLRTLVAPALCVHCMSEFPLNPQEKAEWWDDHMATTHYLAASRVRFTTMVMAWTVSGPFLERLLGPTPATLAWYAPALWVIASLHRHAQLQPWCARCDHGGGGGRERSVSPAPVPSASRA